MIDLGSLLGALAGEALKSTENPLGKIVSSLASGSEQSETDILGTILSVIQQQGGVGSVLGLFTKNGLGSAQESWVSSNPNEALDPEQVEEVLGTSIVSSIASKLGVPQGQASSIVAAVLPELINQITPAGSVSGEQDDIISKGLSLLSRL